MRTSSTGIKGVNLFGIFMRGSVHTKLPHHNELCAHEGYIAEHKSLEWRNEKVTSPYRRNLDAVVQVTFWTNVQIFEAQRRKPTRALFTQTYRNKRALREAA
jgi:hypothetical protein